ncbi:class I SAM-dependent methyltransferase [Pseudonocardia parietis]|uniref:Ubiquinone/menaquinone biosynthesis C-methylase UbiE n=1 Tax=Pseudonocardia parietis TaxID=570936 RepID=A0ABS4W5U2_9PSEU|nr:methyltransferase domain-containing protein [Pseudonocardia parietis]MBP2371288.1 ubiquinone/menaquinone biosynthesis C-methylase UbiE [Pseudonocardia parietis]
MAWGNRRQERWAVDRAKLRPDHQVIVVGCGPGVGLALAAGLIVPSGFVRGVDPSATMRAMATRRCAGPIAMGALEIGDGTAERTGCADQSMDVAISVNNVMLWDQSLGFAELFRVLRPGGLLVLTVHRHVLAEPAHSLRVRSAEVGFVDVALTECPRRGTSPAVELTAHRPR